MPLDTQPARGLDAMPGEPRCGCNGPRSGWIVAVTHPQAEDWAERNLQRRGYRCFLPRYATKRRDPVLHTLTRIVIAPLWPGYCFVHHDSRDSWRPIYETPGVRSVLKTRDQIQWANAGAVEALQAGEALRRTHPSGPHAAWRVGAVAALANGAFRGHAGVIERIEGQKAGITLMLFGELRIVWVDVGSLQECGE